MNHEQRSSRSVLVPYHLIYLPVTAQSDEWSSEFLNLVEGDRNLWTNDFRAFLNSQRQIERQISLNVQPDNAEQWAVQFEQENTDRNAQMNEVWQEASRNAGKFFEFIN